MKYRLMGVLLLVMLVVFTGLTPVRCCYILLGDGWEEGCKGIQEIFYDLLDMLDTAYRNIVYGEE